MSIIRTKLLFFTNLQSDHYLRVLIINLVIKLMELFRIKIIITRRDFIRIKDLEILMFIIAF